MELQPKTKPWFGSNDHMNMENMSIQDLVLVLRTAYLTEPFDSVEEILVSRYNRMQAEIQHFQDKFEMERLARSQAVEDLKKREETCERCKRAESNYEKLLKEVKKTSLADREAIDELKKKNNDLELEVCELRKLKEEWVAHINAIDGLEKDYKELFLKVCEHGKMEEKWVDELRIRVGVLENEKNAFERKNSELEKKNNDLESEVCELRKMKEKWVIDSNALAEVRVRVGVLEKEKNAFWVKNSELQKKNDDLESEVCELKKLKEKWVIDSNALAELRIRVDVLENEKNALAAFEVRNSELEKSLKKISKNLADVGITAFQGKEIVESAPLQRIEPPMKRSKDAQGASSGKANLADVGITVFQEKEIGKALTVEPDEDEPPSKRSKDAQGASSVYIKMGDQSEPMDLFASPPPVVQNTTTMLPPSSKHHSAVWNDFTLDPNSKRTAICNYCGQKVKYFGTTSMAKHSKICKNNPNNETNKRHRGV